MTGTRTPRFAALAALIFLAVATFGVVTRPGFDLTRHAISMLSLGEHGWVMAMTFVITGSLTLVAAGGIRAARRDRPGGHATPALVGVFGAGLVLAGFFPAPPGLGFPPGTPIDLEPVMTPIAIVHAVAFNCAFGALIAAAAVLAGASVRERRTSWAVFSGLVSAGLPALIALGMSAVVPTGVAFYAAAVVAWLWVAAVGIDHTAAEHEDVPNPETADTP